MLPVASLPRRRRPRRPRRPRRSKSSRIMADPRFFRAAGPFTVAELASLTGADIGGAGQADLALDDVAPLDVAGPTQVTFLANPKYAPAFERSNAGAAFVHPEQARRAPAGMTLL